MTFSPGALVRARNREWVVLPESDAELLVLRPLGGTNREIVGAMTARWSRSTPWSITISPGTRPATNSGRAGWTASVRPRPLSG